MYPEVKVNINNIVENAKKVKELCGNKELTVVTKVLTGNYAIIEKLVKEAGIKSIADSHVKNLKLYKNLPVKKWLIRQPRL